MGFLRAVAGIRHKPRDFLKALLILGIGVPVLAGGAALAAFVYLPLPSTVPSVLPGAVAQTSHVYAADGSLLATFHAEHNRELIASGDIPRHLKLAAVAAEDARFFKHEGVDLKAIGRAALADLRARAVVQGGSTITQQYVKNAYLTSRQKTLFRKVREALVASQLERTYSKDKILTNYLNTVYLGKGAYGVQAAAMTYFGKPAKELNVSESAMIAGLIPSPVKFSPLAAPALAEIRRQFVIRRMEKIGYLDSPAAQAALAAKPVLIPPKEQVFRHPWFVDSVLRDLLADPRYGEAKIFSGGLQIHTTLDPRMQQAAEAVLSDTLSDPDDPHAAIASIDPRTGYVKAIVGGRDYGHDKEKFNLALQARRSPGSSFKTMVLVAALENGMSPSSRFRAPGVLRIKGWGNDCECVRNFSNSGYGSATLESATVNSINTVYAQVAQRVGVGKIVETARRMGVSERSLKKDERNLAIAIGGFTEGVTPFEMASAYATLANGGVYHKPKFVTKVIDSQGEVLEEGPSPPVQAVDPKVAFTANRVLSKVVTSGTAQRADIDRPAAGKTGTSQSFNNAWFVGYTPDLSTAVWMGFPKATIPLSFVNGVRNVTGGTIPAQIWAAYMRMALEGIFPSDFTAPGSPTPAATGLGLPPRMGETPTPKPSPPPAPVEDPMSRLIQEHTGATPSPTPQGSSGGGLLGGLFGGRRQSPSPSPYPTPTEEPPVQTTPTPEP